MPSLGSLAEDLECGYTSDEAVAEARVLEPEALLRLAAMALRFADSPWSDRQRDLLRGVSEVRGVDWSKP